MNYRIIAIPVILLSSMCLEAQQNKYTLGTKSDRVVCELSQNGIVNKLVFFDKVGNEQEVLFAQNEWGGFRFQNAPEMKKLEGRGLRFVSSNDSIDYALTYEIVNGGLVVVAELKNNGSCVYAPDKESLNLGVDAWMNKFPEWNHKYFPTLFRCEPSAMWGYMMSPKGDVLVVTSEQPVGSYTINYQQQMYGHYIHTVSFDLVCQQPLPDNHPVVYGLNPGELKRWKFKVMKVDSLDEVYPHVAQHTNLPMISLERFSIQPGQQARIGVERDALIEIIQPSGVVKSVGMCKGGEQVVFDQNSLYGLYQIKAKGSDGSVATANYYVRPDWSWYLDQSRLESLRYVPRSDKSNDCCETWYNLMAFYLAEKYNPDPALLEAGDLIFKQVIDSLFVEKNGLMHTVTYPERVQNVSAMVSIVSDKYHVSKNIDDLKLACKMADYILSRQAESGYYGGYGMKHYTSVLYIAKSILELMDEIEPLAKKDPYWEQMYRKYDASVVRAMDELVSRGRDISTEGDNTFEDGAVACSSLQLLNYALRQTDKEKREKYMNPGLQYLEDHGCLTRLLDPDSRSRGATSRFWECWGDIQTPVQMMLSPHGWSAWRLYASYYAYLLIGTETALHRFMDAMGACTQLMSFPDGVMRNSFNPDPRIMGGVLKPDASNPRGVFVKGIIGNGYTENIGAWYGRNNDKSGFLNQSSWDWCGDGTSFEIIKAMEESVVPNSFVLEREDGTLVAYNCVAQKVGNKIVVEATDHTVVNLHYNLKQKTNIEFVIKDKVIKKKGVLGMGWVS